MDTRNLKITKLYYAVNGTKEPFESPFSSEDFPDLPFIGSILAKGELMRVEEGIMLLFNELQATQAGACARCGKALKNPLQFHPSEWLFYEEKPDKDDASDELLFLDKSQLEIDPYEPLRQELILNMDPALHCPKPCKEFAEPEKGVKALSKLKEIL